MSCIIAYCRYCGYKTDTLKVYDMGQVTVYMYSDEDFHIKYGGFEIEYDLLLRENGNLYS